MAQGDVMNQKLKEVILKTYETWDKDPKKHSTNEEWLETFQKDIEAAFDLTEKKPREYYLVQKERYTKLDVYKYKPDFEAEEIIHVVEVIK